MSKCMLLFQFFIALSRVKSSCDLLVSKLVCVRAAASLYIILLHSSGVFSHFSGGLRQKGDHFGE